MTTKSHGLISGFEVRDPGFSDTIQAPPAQGGTFGKETSPSPSKPITHRDCHGTYREHSPKRAGRASLHTAALGSGGGWNDHWQTQFVSVGRLPTPGYIDQPHCWLPELPPRTARKSTLRTNARQHSFLHGVVWGGELGSAGGTLHGADHHRALGVTPATKASRPRAHRRLARGCS